MARQRVTPPGPGEHAQRPQEDGQRLDVVVTEVSKGNGGGRKRQNHGGHPRETLPPDLPRAEIQAGGSEGESDRRGEPPAGDVRAEDPHEDGLPGVGQHRVIAPKPPFGETGGGPPTVQHPPGGPVKENLVRRPRPPQVRQIVGRPHQGCGPQGRQRRHLPPREWPAEEDAVPPVPPGKSEGRQAQRGHPGDGLDRFPRRGPSREESQAGPQQRQNARHQVRDSPRRAAFLPWSRRTKGSERPRRPAAAQGRRNQGGARQEQGQPQEADGQERGRIPSGPVAKPIKKLVRRVFGSRKPAVSERQQNRASPED